MGEEKHSLIGKYASLEVAQTHFEASRVRRFKNLGDSEKLDVCPCCKLPISASLFELNCGLEEIGELGVGFPLFFYYMKYVGLLLCIVAIIAGAECLTANLIENKQGEYGSGSSLWYLRQSTAAYGGANSVPVWQGVLHSLAIIVLVFCHYRFKQKITRFNKKTDLQNISPSDFTIWVKNLRENFNIENLLEVLVNSSELGLDKASVHTITIVSDVHELVKTSAYLTKLEVEYMRTVDYQNIHGRLPTKFWKCNKVSLEAMENELQETRQIVETLKRSIQDSRQVGQVFVTFHKMSQCASVAKNFYLSSLKRALFKVFFCCYATSAYFEDRPIKVVQAPQPSDIIWENLQVTFNTRMKSRLLTWLATFLLIGANVVVIYFLKNEQKDLYKNYENTPTKDQDEDDLAEVYFWSILISISIIIVNAIIEIIVRFLTLREDHHTWTDFHISVFHKLFIGYTLNSAGVIIFINYQANEKEGDWYKPTGLLNDVTSVIISTAISTVLEPVFAPDALWKFYSQYTARKAADRGNLLLSQRELNTVWEGPQFDISGNYASNLRLFTITLLFAMLFPTGLFIAIASQVVQYLVFKYLLLRRCVRPRLLGDALSSEVIRWIPLIFLLYSISVIYVVDKTTSGIGRLLLPFLAFFVAVVYVFFPFVCNNRVIPDGSLLFLLTDEEDEYDMHLPNFYIDYERANPYTSNNGWEKWQELTRGYTPKLNYLQQAQFHFSGEYSGVDRSGFSTN